MRNIRSTLSSIAVLLALFGELAAAGQTRLSPEVERYVRAGTPRIVLTHVRVIDGTGSNALEQRNVVIEDGKISSIDAASAVSASTDTTVLDLQGFTVMPGIVGMHDHLYYIAVPNYETGKQPLYEGPILLPQMTFSAPRLYLANGVTTLRTAGSVEPYADLNLRDQIDAGILIGPHIDVTAPYLEGSGNFFVQMHTLKNAREARDFVDYWASVGASSYKAYMHITRAELSAAIRAAHGHGQKITGHLCSVTYPEAAEMGIDNLEHGFFVNTQLDTNKKSDLCPDSAGDETLKRMDPDGPDAASLIALLISHHVAITSTLAVFEPDLPGRPPLQARMLDALSPRAREAYLYARDMAHAKPNPDAKVAWDHELRLERKFVAAGGLLLAGADPTGTGAVLPGFGDQREIELLVEAGFTPVEAIRIATLNGAIYEGRQRAIGSIEVGKNADLVVIKGDPSQRIEDIENTEMVFKDGVAYDAKKLIGSVTGRFGEY